ncbi:MAG: hypothetical protein DIZ80_09290 [endosymbiont of Galathealinum brachiosum]|uniref:Uncharacterized protein n=1 Tax=endosymbiont of Galathealinum brachiosum TaxID=2200906 RepID=A0A370DDL4_9GAMM|nr:MAG: hypothetical protein DIZ80_09290 [endosymbiont of Galathealinum brachiosum]
MDYIKSHWRGNLSLTISFWINFILLNIILMPMDSWLLDGFKVESPVVVARIYIFFAVVAPVVIYPWQVVGLWRSADKHAKRINSVTWSGIVKVLIIISFISIFSHTQESWPKYKEMYHLGFVSDDMAVYTMVVTDDGRYIHLKGLMGFGVSKDLAKVIKNNPMVEGVILDSRGGRIFEGREVSKLILLNNLNTYSITGCYSSCGTAFISGVKRYLAIGANLGFHQYKNTLKSIDTKTNIIHEEKKDLELFRMQGVSEIFIERVFQTLSDDLWYPTIEEMLEAGVIDGLVKPSDLVLIKYDKDFLDEIHKAFDEYPVYIEIKKHDPTRFEKIIGDMEQKLNTGLSHIEIQQSMSKDIEDIAMQSLHQASDETIVAFTQEMINLLKVLHSIEPVYCLKNMFPEKYGALELAKYVKTDELKGLSDIFVLVIRDSYVNVNLPIDSKAAVDILDDLYMKMDVDLEYIYTKQLSNREDYSRSCNAVIKLYEYIIAHDNKVAANTLRFMYSP